MTALAARAAAFFELSAMRILVAIAARKRQRAIAHERFAIYALGFVALAARNLLVLALERKPRHIVIKFCLAPAFHSMASSASLRRQAFGKLSAVLILMA